MRFVKSQSRVKPLLVEIFENVAYVRKNVVTETINGDIFYIYDEAALTLEEFNSYANSVLMTDQESAIENQLTIMEAFADLYETIALNM